MRMIWFHTYDYPCVCTLFSFLSERKHPTLTSYSRISQLSPSDFVSVAAWIATWSDSVCRIRSHSQPHDKSHAVYGHMESPSSVYMLFHFCRITHNACRLRLPRIWNPSFTNCARTKKSDFVQKAGHFHDLAGRGTSGKKAGLSRQKRVGWQVCQCRKEQHIGHHLFRPEWNGTQIWWKKAMIIARISPPYS